MSSLNLALTCHFRYCFPDFCFLFFIQLYICQNFGFCYQKTNLAGINRKGECIIRISGMCGTRNLNLQSFIFVSYSVPVYVFASFCLHVEDRIFPPHKSKPCMPQVLPYEKHVCGVSLLYLYTHLFTFILCTNFQIFKKQNPIGSVWVTCLPLLSINMEARGCGSPYMNYLPKKPREKMGIPEPGRHSG